MPVEQPEVEGIEREPSPAPPAYNHGPEPSPGPIRTLPSDLSQTEATHNTSNNDNNNNNNTEPTPETVTAEKQSTQMVNPLLPSPPKVTPLHLLGEEPEWIDCPFCERRALTRVQQDNSTMTIMAGVLCCLLCGICCACLPCLCGWLQDIDHFCTNCGKKVAHRPHDGPVQVLRPVDTREVPSKDAMAGPGPVAGSDV